MNERIQELAEQAEMAANNGDSVDVKIMMDKFAELIVRECARYFNEDYVRDFYISWREDLSKGIKDHFGVEE